MTASAVDRYLERRDKGRRRDVITPEGVPLGFTLAQMGDRVAAFALDGLLLILTTVGLFLLWSVVLAPVMGQGWTTPFVLIALFVLTNFYFLLFELRWQGATPGKRVVGIRVIDRRGGVLSADAVIARNLLRNVDVWLPLQVLLVPEAVGAGGGFRLLALGWIVVLGLVPLFNADRMRAGDLVAGTLVVLSPKAVLLPDIGGQEAARAAAAEAMYAFSPEQLDVYGIYELQVLEDVLRDEAKPGYGEALTGVCEPIKRKIGWDRKRWQVHEERFLREFYTALRAHLERKMLFGERREDKHARGDRVRTEP